MKVYRYDYDDELDVDVEEPDTDDDENMPDTMANLGFKYSDFL